MTTKQPATPAPANDTTAANGALNDSIRNYVRAYSLWHGRPKAARHFGVSRHTLWRFLEREYLGRSLPRAVTGAVGDSIEAIDAATWAIGASERITANFERSARNRRPADPALRRGQEDALLQLCAAPLTTVNELARFNREPPTTLRDRLDRLAELGLADSVSHRLGALGPKPQRRYFPTEKGIHAAAALEPGIRRFLADQPVSRQWFRILAERLDAVAVLYHVAALIADADPEGGAVRVDHHRQGPYDLLVTLSEGRSVGILRQGQTLPSAHLRYRLRTVENLPWSQRPTVTLVVTGSDQATRRAVRTLGHTVEHQTFFVTTEGEQLAGDHRAVAWQQCGHGMGAQVKIEPCLSLKNIVASIGWLVDRDARNRRDQTPPAKREPTPDPYSLYPTHLRAAIPDPQVQVKSSLAVQLTRAEKEALDLLAAWPLCTTDQLVGLMGGVTRRRANHVLRSITQHSLVNSENQRHVLADDGLRYLARRDRTAIRVALGRWSARKRRRSRGAPTRYRRHLPAQPGLPTGPPGRHQHACCRPERRGRPLQGPPPAGTAAHIPLQHRLPLPGRRLRDPPRCHLLDVIPGRLAPLFPGIRAPRRHPQEGSRQAEELSPLLRQRLGRPGPRRAAAPGAVRLRDPRRRGRLPAGRRSAPAAHLHLQPGADRRPWRVTRGVRWPPPNSSDRLPLHRLGERYKNVPSRSRHFL